MPNKPIIGITGKIGSGKTTIANYLVDKYDYTEYGMADPLKGIGKLFGFSDRQLYGTQEEKLEIHPYWNVSARHFLQKVGTDLFREHLHEVLPEMKMEGTIWVEIFKMENNRFPKQYVISDIRFLDEAKAIKDMGGIIIRTVRGDTSGGNTYTKHRSEMEMDKIDADYTIDNNCSMEELQDKLNKLVENL